MSEPIVDFFVPGIPRPGGSKRAFAHKSTGRIIVTDSAGERVTEWRAAVKHFAYNAYHGDPLDEPLSVMLTFCFVRPKAHYGTGCNASVLKPSAPLFPMRQPDTTKLVRSTEDACTGVLWTDDARIVHQVARKEYSNRPGCRIIVERMVGARHPAPAAATRLFDRQETIPC